MDKALMTFKSHVEGKNSDVAIFADRIEWSHEGRLGAGSKAALGVATMGVSLLKTGVRKAKDSETIPIRSISSVVIERDGFRQEVKVITSGNTIAFRCGRQQAEDVKHLLMDLISGRELSTR